MRTRMVRVRRRPRGVVWAVVFLIIAMALYIRVSLPALREMQAAETSAAGRGERVTREITIDALESWLVSFGEYDTASSAKVEAARYVSRGAAGYVLDGERLYVIGAGYAAEAEAEKVCAQLEAEEGISCAVVALSSPAVTLRMTAGSEQIAAFLEAEQALRSSAGALGQLAFSIDKGEATAQQAGEVIRTHLAKAKAAEEKLDALTEGTENRILEGLEELLDDMCGQMEEMLEETKAMALSSRLKYCHVDFRVREIELMNSLSG